MRNPLDLSLPGLVWATFRFSQPFSGLLFLNAHRPYLMPNPLMGFCPSESFPSTRFGIPFGTTVTVLTLALMNDA